MQLEEEESWKEDKPGKHIKETTRNLFIYFIILKKNILHVVVRQKMMRKYDVERKDTYILYTY